MLFAGKMDCICAHSQCDSGLDSYYRGLQDLYLRLGDSQKAMEYDIIFDNWKQIRNRYVKYH